MKIRTLVLLLIALGASALAPSRAAAASDLDVLADWMTGSFSSAAQAAADTSYFDIRLEMVRIWPDRDDAVWLYVEQALGTRTDAPYRQRVYRVSEVKPGLFESAVFTLPDPDAVVGCWKRGEPLADLSPADLALREGCAVLLRRDLLGAFSGGTVGRGCASDLRGATYAESAVTVTRAGIESWDRGFDADGAHVWGAEHGPYVFLRMSR